MAVSALPAAAATDCPAFPKVDFWGKLSHDSVRALVDNRLDGDWGAYVKQLEKQQATLAAIHKRGSAALISRSGKQIKVEGAELAKYLAYSSQRLSVVRCLADAYDLNSLDKFSTASGDPGASIGVDMERTYITIPKDLLEKLRRKAVHESAKKARKTSVSEVIVDILERELK